MTWQGLLGQKRVAREGTSRHEVADLWKLAERALADATLDAPISDDGRFDRAYDAARALATIVVRASGYRVKGAGGAHYNTFLALEAANPEDFTVFAAYFNLCREKRNELSYVRPGVVSRGEVDELLRETARFRNLVAVWLRERRPDLA
jgi:hypothetical protein